MNNSIINILNRIENSNSPNEILGTEIVKNNINSLLYYAIENEYYRTTSIILEKQININLQNIDILIKKIVELSKDFNYKLISYLYFLKIMIDKGIHINTKAFYDIKNYLEKQDYYGNTIMHILISNEYIFLLKFLIIKFKPNMNIQNMYGDTILHIISILYYRNNDKIEYLDIINFLLKNGSSNDIKNTSLMLPENYINLNLIY